MKEARQGKGLTGSWKDFRECHIKPDLVLLSVFHQG